MPEEPNDRLRALLTEAQLSGAALSRAVNQLAAENNVTLTYGRATASRWLRGVRPRPPTPQLIAEVLSRRLNRTVTCETAGFGEVPSPAGDPLRQLTALASSTPGGDRMQARLIYNVATLQDVPAWDHAAATITPCHSGTRRPHVGRAEVAAAAHMAEVFANSAAFTGAGPIRPALSAYLATPVVAWLRASTGDRVRPSLYSTAARLTYLCGYLCFDDELHGSAQRYLHTALALAVEAGDPTAYAIGLRALSMQARRLGHFKEALGLALTALATPAPSPAQTQALLHSEVAVACAAMGDASGTRYHLKTAEAELQRDTKPQITVGTYGHADHAQQQAAAHSLLGEHPTAISALKDSIRRRSLVERHSQTLALADLAELQLTSGQVDQAIQTWHRFLVSYPAVQSGRVRTAFKNMRSNLRSYANYPPAQALLHRTATLSRAEHKGPRYAEARRANRERPTDARTRDHGPQVKA